jgi:hypothetical protein
LIELCLIFSIGPPVSITSLESFEWLHIFTWPDSTAVRSFLEREKISHRMVDLLTGNYSLLMKELFSLFLLLS